MKQLEKITTKKTIFSTFLLILALVMCLIPLAGCSSSYKNSSYKNTKTSFALDTVISITYYDEKDSDAVDSALSYISDLELIFSRTNESSELYAVNQAIAEGTAIHVSDILYDAMALALSSCASSEGKFDITLGKVSDLWNFTGENPHVPDSVILAETLSHTGYQHLTLTDDQMLSSDERELSVDLGGMAKGYIGRLAKEKLIEAGVESAIINLGGNVVAIGSKPDGSPYQIGISKPEKETEEYATTVEVTDACVVTSGIYQRYFEENGKWYHHILDSSTGYPIESDIASATAICADSAVADILSTTFFAMGCEKTEEYISMVNMQIKAIFILKDGTIKEYSNY